MCSSVAPFFFFQLMSTNFKPFYLEYNEFQGVFHYNYKKNKDTDSTWRRLSKIKNEEEHIMAHNFTKFMYEYNMRNGYVMSLYEVVFAYDWFTTCKHNNKIYLVNKTIPARPGVYKLYDSDRYLIYIGKSKCLKTRLPQSIKERGAYYFSFAITESDADAFMYEQYYMSKIQKPICNEEYPEQESTLTLPELFFTTITAIIR